ncbi:MAG: hypothetical protein HPY74_20410 [Firmicutes bacterium]|nr:hypothetical protein [Bacillota bacterium]
MNNNPVDQSIINKIYETSGVAYFDNNLRPIIEDVIKELFYSHRELIFLLQLNHIDRALYKFRQAKGNNHIRNTKQYFKACIISAIKETVLDNLDLVE